MLRYISNNFILFILNTVSATLTILIFLYVELKVHRLVGGSDRLKMLNGPSQ